MSPSESITCTTAFSGRSHPQLNDWTPLRSGLSTAPPDCAAIVYRWFGNDGPWALAKKRSNRTYSLAHRQ